MIAALLKGHKAVISSVRFTASDPQTLIEAVRASGVKRYVVVVGAGSFTATQGKRLSDQPDFPDAYRAEATKGAEFLSLLKTVDDVNWTFLSPSALFVAGERTGKFRIGKDELLVGENGSKISFEDYAIALVDEIERPAHVRERFTVGYQVEQIWVRDETGLMKRKCAAADPDRVAVGLSFMSRVGVRRARHLIA